jgi:hypothetical protein
VLDALIHVRREGQEAIGRRRARQDDFDTPAARQLLEPSSTPACSSPSSTTTARPR